MNPAAESLITSLGFDLDDFKALMRQDINRFQLLLLIATKIDVSDVDPADTKDLLRQDLTETDLLCLIAVKVGSGAIGSQLAAPAGIAVTPTNLSFDVSFSAVTGAASYEWRLDGVGSWANIGTATTFSSTGSAGLHTVKVRAIDGSAVAGHTGTSASFTLAAVAAPVFSVNPVATSSGDLANPVVGDILHSTSGTASGSPSFAYQWRHVSDNSNAAGTGNATANYTAAVADEAGQLYCHVTATNSGGSALANSNSSGVVVAASVPPSLITRPALSTSGTVYTVTSNGTWTNSPSSYTYQWKSALADISGATASAYDSAGVAGNYSCYVTAHNAAGSSVPERVSSGLPTAVYLDGDSTVAPVGITTATQSEFDTRFGAGQFTALNIAHSGDDVAVMTTKALTAFDPQVQKGSTILLAFEYANDIAGLQGIHTGAETTARLWSYYDARVTTGAFVFPCTAPYRSGGIHDGTEAHIASENIRNGYLSHGCAGLVELDTTAIRNDINSSGDGIHETSAAYPLFASAYVDAVQAAGIPGGCGDIVVAAAVYDNLKVYNGDNPGPLTYAYVYDPVTSLQMSPNPAGQCLVITSSTSGWVPGAYFCDGTIGGFNTGSDGLQDLYHGGPSPAPSGSSGGHYVPFYATTGRHEVSQVQFDSDISGAINGASFRLAYPGGTVDFYLTNGSASAPTGATRQIPVSFTNNDDRSVIGAAVAAAIVADGYWWVNDHNSGGIYAIAADKLPGARANVTASGYGVHPTTIIEGN